MQKEFGETQDLLKTLGVGREDTSGRKVKNSSHYDTSAWNSSTDKSLCLAKLVRLHHLRPCVIQFL